MRRHDIDAFSLIAGTVFVIVGLTAIGAVVTDTYLKATVIAPLMLLGLGVAGLAGSVRRLRSGRRDDTGAERL